jgi:serine/threonine-protein kinase HipA
MPTRILGVFLNETFVGDLTQLLDGTTFLAFDPDYVIDRNRPTLSLSYKNILNNVASSTKRPSAGLPPFFANLLPEGPLRKYLAKKAGVKETQEYRLLAALRDDLPGAVMLQPREDFRVQDVDDEITDSTRLASPLRFSLAGVQLKFSGDLRDSKMVIPANGVDGHWIVKLPSPGYLNVTELEYSMLLLASKIGITVPEFKLWPTANIENLPHDLPEAFEGDCLISQRFDRTFHGGRIHMEDFAQVFGLRDKYDPVYNYQSIANVLWIEIGLDAVLEFVRRLVHMILIGNADMHLKNWSLIYPDGRHPELSPAYDLVSTIVYDAVDEKLALKLVGLRDFKRISLQAFRKFSSIAKLPERPVINTVIETVDAIKEHWPRLRSEFNMPESYKRLIEEHMKTIPLFYERATLIAAAAPIPLETAWPGSFFNAEIKLDENLAAGEIVFRNQLGSEIKMQAPRRMVDALVNKQLHQLITEHRDFANQNIQAFVGLSLYDQWRSDRFIRLTSRLVAGGLDEQILERPQYDLTATFFPIDWRKLERQNEAREQTFTIDFELANGEIWGCECTIGLLDNVILHPDGKRTADVRFYKRKAEKLFILPEDAKNRYGSPRFSVSLSTIQKSTEKRPKLSSPKALFSGFILPWHTNGELSITASEDNEVGGEYRYKTRHFTSQKEFLQCLEEIGVPQRDLPNMDPNGFNRIVSLYDIEREPLQKRGLLERLH